MHALVGAPDVEARRGQVRRSGVEPAVELAEELQRDVHQRPARVEHPMGEAAVLELLERGDGCLQWFRA